MSKIDLRKQILGEMKKRKISIPKMSRTIGCNQQTLYDFFAGRKALGAKYVSYYAAGGDTERRILALITYLGPQPMDGMRGGSRPQYEILIRNDAAAGITAAELDTGTDKLQIPPRIGRAAITVRIANIVKQDKAMLLLRAW